MYIQIKRCSIIILAAEKPPYVKLVEPVLFDELLVCRVFRGLLMA